MSFYQHIFFDLDGTLWDFEGNSRETQKELFKVFRLEKYCNKFENFNRIYQKYNDQVWSDYRKGRISKEKLKWYRFYLTLKDCGLCDKVLAKKLDVFYLNEAPKKKKLIPGTMELLAYLSETYELHILTNGFNEVQFIKMENSGLNSFFQSVITSEDAGALKPNLLIFQYALKKTGAKQKKSLMVGDIFEVDIIGAKNAGIDQAFFNPEEDNVPEPVTYEIARLEELIGIL
jgi:putative hydrolase of the HAD superfamily